MTLGELNQRSVEEVRQALLACCGSVEWADRLVSQRPYQNHTQLCRDAENEWWALDKSDWLEAFSKHPQIGANNGVTVWASEEQAGMSHAGAATSEAMQHLNREYFDKFGWIYIVCATGKSGEEMRADIERRMTNRASDELQIAAAEQAKIMHVRLGKLLGI